MPKRQLFLADVRCTASKDEQELLLCAACLEGGGCKAMYVLVIGRTLRARDSMAGYAWACGNLKKSRPTLSSRHQDVWDKSRKVEGLVLASHWSNTGVLCNLPSSEEHQKGMMKTCKVKQFSFFWTCHKIACAAVHQKAVACTFGNHERCITRVP